MEVLLQVLRYLITLSVILQLTELPMAYILAPLPHQTILQVFIPILLVD